MSKDLSMSETDLRNNPLAQAIFGGDDKLIGQYMDALESSKKYQEKLCQTSNENLYNALISMERDNPSVSRIRKMANISYERGAVVGKDFMTNQPIYRENTEVTPELKRTLDSDLGYMIDAPVGRVLFLGMDQGYLTPTDQNVSYLGVVPEVKK